MHAASSEHLAAPTDNNIIANKRGTTESQQKLITIIIIVASSIVANYMHHFVGQLGNIVIIIGYLHPANGTAPVGERLPSRA